jgi:hypothetical protein
VQEQRRADAAQHHADEAQRQAYEAQRRAEAARQRAIALEAVLARYQERFGAPPA